MTDPQEDKTAPEKAKAAHVKMAMQETLRLTKKLGAGLSGLFQRLKNDRSPEAMLATLEQQAQANLAKREQTSAEVEKLYTQIAVRKKAFKTAPQAKKRILEAELKSLLAAYKTKERLLGILFENERNLDLVKGRLNEVAAYGLAGVSESMMDDVIDQVEDHAAEAEARADAARDLERAGRRRDWDRDSEDLWGELDGFEEESEPAPMADELADFEVDEPAERDKRHRREAEEEW